MKPTRENTPHRLEERVTVGQATLQVVAGLDGLSDHVNLDVKFARSHVLGAADTMLFRVLGWLFTRDATERALWLVLAERYTMNGLWTSGSGGKNSGMPILDAARFRQWVFSQYFTLLHGLGPVHKGASVAARVFLVWRLHM